jgi:hypothetical protein
MPDQPENERAAYEALNRSIKAERLVEVMLGRLSAAEAALLLPEEWRRLTDALQLRPASVATRRTVLTKLAALEKTQKGRKK